MSDPIQSTQSTPRRLTPAEAGLRAGDALARKHNRRDTALLALLLIVIIATASLVGLHV